MRIMEVPENFRALGTVGTSYKGEYQPGQEYKYANTVYYDSSTYIALKDNPEGEPNDDNLNWKYLARGTQGDIYFTSGDKLNPEEPVDVELVKNNEPLKNFLESATKMFRNLRYLFKIMGDTDISEIGDGTVTGILNSLNTDTDYIFAINDNSNCTFKRRGNIVTAVIELRGVVTPDTWADKTLFTLPDNFRPAIGLSFNVTSGILAFISSTDGRVRIQPISNDFAKTTLGFCDICISYLVKNG